MANRRFYQFRLSLEPQVVDLYAHVTFGASGAPTLDTSQSRGIVSMSRISAGRYSIALRDNYNRLLMVDNIAISSSPAASPDVRVITDSVVDSSAPLLVIEYSSAGVATDPASGEEARLQISVKNSNV